MLNLHIIATVDQKVLSLLAKFPDKEFYERQIACKIGIKIKYNSLLEWRNKTLSVSARIFVPPKGLA